MLGGVLTALGQIPIHRGTGDKAAIASAGSILSAGEAVCVFPEGQLSRGTELRARRGVVRLWSGCPNARVVLCATTGATDFVRFPRRPRVRIRFIEPTGGQPHLDEDPQALATRLLADGRALAPPAPAGRRHQPRPTVGRVRNPSHSVTPATGEIEP